MSTQLSPDGLYFWDGRQWLSTLSHDGRNRWNGTAWVPVSPAPESAKYYQPSRPLREPTSWTRPLQYAVAVWYSLQAVYVLSLPFWMGGPMAQAMNQSIQRQQQLYPTATPPPAGFTDALTSMMTGALWVAAVFGLAFCAVIAVGALKRWTWMFYVVLVLLGLGAISLPLDLLNAVTGSAVSAASGFSLPSWTYWLGFVISIPGTALFAWMLIALVQRGPWGMKKVAASVI